MVEAIQCPSCQTRYGLRPARVRTGLRRAQCFRCGDVFHIEIEVKRLLAELAPADTANLPLSALAEAIHPPHAPESAPTPALDANELALADFELPEPGEPASWPAPAETAPIPSMAVAAEHPATEHPAEPLVEPQAAPEPPLEPEPAADAGGTYASAKDAIARLFGDTPLAPSPATALRGALNPGRMDVDAGLQALEDTLGGVKPEALSTRPFHAPEAAPVLPVPAPPAAAPMEEGDLPHTASTMRLSAAEMLAAVGAAAPAAHAPEPPEITQEEVTMVLPPLPPPPSAAEAPADPSALRLRIGDQVYSGLDLSTIAKWIEEGRVLEDHQVARGASETWMDAAKVPALRPVFERLRRSRGGLDLPPPPPGIGDTSAKRGLFGGMFGKKD